MLEGRRIDLQAVGQLPKPDAADVGELCLLRVAQVAHQRAAGADRGLAALEPKAFEALHAQLIEQRLPRRLELEVPAVDLGDGRANLRDLGDRRRDVVTRRDDDLSRPEHGDLGSQRRESVRPRIFGDIEFAGRDVDQCDAVIAGREADEAVATIAIRNAGSFASRYAASVNVPGDTTRTTSRLTTPFAVFGFSICSQIATR